MYNVLYNMRGTQVQFNLKDSSRKAIKLFEIRFLNSRTVS